MLYHPQCTEEQLQRKLKKFGLPKEPALFTQLREEMRTASEHLLSQNPCYMEAAVAAKGSDYFNLPGTAFSLLRRRPKSDASWLFMTSGSATACTSER